METVLKLLDEIRQLRDQLADQEIKIAMLESKRFGGDGAATIANVTEQTENESYEDAVEDEVDSMEMYSSDDMQSPSSGE